MRKRPYVFVACFLYALLSLCAGKSFALPLTQSSASIDLSSFSVIHGSNVVWGATGGGGDAGTSVDYDIFWLRGPYGTSINCCTASADYGAAFAFSELELIEGDMMRAYAEAGGTSAAWANVWYGGEFTATGIYNNFIAIGSNFLLSQSSVSVYDSSWNYASIYMELANYTTGRSEGISYTLSGGVLTIEKWTDDILSYSYVHTGMGSNFGTFDNIGHTIMFNTGEQGGFILAANTHAYAVYAVPEPGTMLLLGSGLIGLIGLRKKFCLRSNG